jgi:hypothetical protein
MGLGELAALLTQWVIERAESGTIMLLEEPETFLSSRSTVALLDVLVDQVNAKRLYAIVTTHSPDLVSKAPLSSVRLLTYLDGVVSVTVPNTRAELEQSLGAYVGQARIVLTEDRVAGVLTSELLSRFGGLWGGSVEILWVSGASAVLALCRDFPPAQGLRLVGVLDGDQPQPAPSGWPVLRLPGTEAPDVMLRRAALEAPERFAAALGRPLPQLNLVLAATSGVDAHDWFPAVAQAVMVEPTHAIRSAVQCWLGEEHNDREAREVVASITTAIIAS